MLKRPVFLSISIGKFCRSWLWNRHASSNLEGFVPYRESSTRSFPISATALKRSVPRSLPALATRLYSSHLLRSRPGPTVFNAAWNTCRR